jgi:hypothetical protein
MVRQSFLVAMLASCFGAGCGKPAANGGPPATAAPIAPAFPTKAQPPLPTTKLWLGPEELTAELALTGEQQQTGMMFRTNMAENEAMLFVFNAPGRSNFYMRNCTVPLTAAYINPAGVIEKFAQLEPGDTNGVPSKSWNIQYVLALPQGWP